MEIAVRLPYHTSDASGEVMARVAVAAEQAGMHSGWVADHIVFPGRPRRPLRAPRALFLESIELMRRCWESPPVTYEGEEFSTGGPVHFVPRPSRPIPLLGGGHSEPALRRAATIMQGWVGHELLPDESAAMGRRLVDVAGGRATRRRASTCPCARPRCAPARRSSG